LFLLGIKKVVPKTKTKVYFDPNYFGISFGTNFRSFQLKMQCLIAMHLKHMFLEQIRIIYVTN